LHSPTTAKELFNLQHAQAHNIIEYIFGVSKHRFRLMIAYPGYSPATQAKFIPTMAVLHIFLRVHCPSDHRDLLTTPGVHERPQQHPQVVPKHFDADISEAEVEEVSAQCDCISQQMWEIY
ncbi:hypothetical protein BV22DRAFT_1024181, partial [Leucogyrophana mollusca]